MGILARLWELPPREAVRKASRRLRGDRGFDAEEILNSNKHMRPQRFYDFLSRYEAILTRIRGWTPLEFSGRQVLEIGCGPMLGFGPLAVFRGAESYTAVEPGYQSGVLEDQRILDKYFRGIHRDLSALYGERGSFDDYVADLRRVIKVIENPILEAEIEGPVDIVLSNSCLEHISPFAESIKALHEFCADDCKFVNLVDFGSHRAGPSPFTNVYSRSRDDYLAGFGHHVNLLRASDMVSAFREAGFDADLVPYTSMRESYDGVLHDFWTSRYDEDELFLKTGILFGPASQFPPRDETD